MESSFPEEDLEVLVDNQWTVSQQWPPEAKKANSLLGCDLWAGDCASRLREEIHPQHW